MKATPRPVYPGEESRYPFSRNLDGLWGRSGGVKKTPPPLGIDGRTFKPVASRYTDYAVLQGIRRSLFGIDKINLMAV